MKTIFLFVALLIFAVNSFSQKHKSKENFNELIDCLESTDTIEADRLLKFFNLQVDTIDLSRYHAVLCCKVDLKEMRAYSCDVELLFNKKSVYSGLLIFTNKGKIVFHSLIPQYPLQADAQYHIYKKRFYNKMNGYYWE